MGLKALCKKTPFASPDSSVLDAVHTMTETHTGAVAIMEGKKIVGMFTERDLVRRIVALGKDPKTTRMRDVMSSPVHAVSDDTPVAKAAAIMREHHIRHLAVLDANGELEGVVALRYLLYELMDELESKVGSLYSYLMVDGPGGD